MGRIKFSKDKKIKACESYISGKGSFISIAKELGCSGPTVRQWYLTYKIHGANAFITYSKNRTFTKEFKLNVIEEYISGKYSYADLSAKYIIDTKMLRNWVKLYYNGIDIKDYKPESEVYTMKSRKTTFKQRLEIVKWVIENDMNYKEAAKKFKVNYAAIYRWVKLYIEDGSKALKYKKRGPKPKSKIDENSLGDVEKLKLALEREKTLRKRVEFELEVLKKKEEFERKLHSRKSDKKQST